MPIINDLNLNIILHTKHYNHNKKRDDTFFVGSAKCCGVDPLVQFSGDIIIHGNKKERINYIK